MGRLRIIQKDTPHNDTAHKKLPTWYMTDYSVLALVVEKCETTIDVLQAQGFSIIEDSGEKRVVFDNPKELRRIVTLLADNAIAFSLSDSVTQIYQG